MASLSSTSTSTSTSTTTSSSSALFGIPQLTPPSGTRAFLPSPSFSSKICRLSRGHHRQFSRPHCKEQRLVTRSFLQELLVELNYNDIPSEGLLQEKRLHEKGCSIATLEPNTERSSEAEDSGALEEIGHAAVLPSLQVQSPEEQEALAATPAHPEGLYALYASFFAGNFIEQVWHFAWPSAVALLHDSLLPVAVVSFVSKLVVFVGGPWIGAKMDCLPRVFAFNALSALQTVAQVASAGAIIYGFQKATSSASHSALLVQPWFITLVLMAAIERLTGLASGVAFERDWVVLLAGANRPIALAEANAMLCRVDLLCEMAGTSFYGILLSQYHPATCLMLAAAVMVGSLPVLVLLVYCTNKLSKGILERPKYFKLREIGMNQRSTAENCSTTKDGHWHMFKFGWVQYLAQPALPASLAAVFLYFNVGLSPGSLMTSFLTQKGLNPSIIGAFSGMGAFMGFGATFLSAALVRRVGVLKAGAAGLVFQAGLLAVAVMVYWSNSLVHPDSVTFFLALIIFSRLGHFTYDIVGGQILQTAVHPSQANTIGTTEISLASLAELLMLGVAIVANDVSHFGHLAALSLAAVIAATILYFRWMASLPKDLRSPSFDNFSGVEDSSWETDSQGEYLCTCNI